MADEIRNFMGYLWYKEEDGVVTIGINEEGLEDFDEISSVELPPEGEKIEADVVLGTIETDDGPLDIYSPVDGTILEVNGQVIEEPALIQEDPYEEGWLIKIEAVAPGDDDEDEDDDSDDDDDDDDDSDDEDEEDERG
jgi:glycine cleavage system H protein